MTASRAATAAAAAAAAAVLAACSPAPADTSPSAAQTPPAAPATTPSATAPASAQPAASDQLPVSDQLTVPETPWWQMPEPPRPSGTDFVLSGSVLFQPDSPTLTTGAASQLSLILPAIQAQPDAQVIIGGHTDTGGGGPAATAKALSLARAEAVMNWLITNGVAAERITPQGWGDSDPLYPSDTDAHRAANRRCEITLKTPTR